PRPLSFGMAVPQPAFCATRCRTAAWRLAPPTEFGASPALRPLALSIPTRKATGSAPRSWAASSMNDSTAKLVQPGPTARSQPGRKAVLATSFDNARTRCAPTSYQWSAPAMAKGSYFLPYNPSDMAPGIMTSVGQPADA